MSNGCKTEPKFMNFYKFGLWRGNVKISVYLCIKKTWLGEACFSFIDRTLLTRLYFVMNQKFEMVAKTFQGLEDVLAEELRALGADNVEVGRRMVSFEGDLGMMYKANMCCRTALRILKPIYKFIATDPDSLYEMVKEFDWEQILSLDETFSIDSVVNSDEFTHSRFVTYRVKDAIVDFFQDKYGVGKRPRVRLEDADVALNVHISGERITLSLDSSGESLHRRGYRVAQTEAPINEVLAAGIILKSGWKGDRPFVDPMCGSGTFLIEAALIAANINPGVYRKDYAFEHWADFDRELFESLYNDDSNESEPQAMIYGADMSAAAIEIARKNIKSAGVAKYIDLQVKALSEWEEAPEGGILVTNPPYGKRLSIDDMNGLYDLLGRKLKFVFKNYQAWVIGYKSEYFDAIGLAASSKTALFNGSLECELREYHIFDGKLKDFKAEGGSIRSINDPSEEEKSEATHSDRLISDRQWKEKARRGGFGGRDSKDKERGGFRGRDGKRDSRRESERGEFRSRDGKRDGRRESERGGFRGRDGKRDSRRDDERGGFRGKGFKDENSFGRRDGRRNWGNRRDSEELSPENRRAESRRGDADPENPFAVRRNVHALKSIKDRKPSLPPTDGAILRHRKRKGDEDEK